LGVPVGGVTGNYLVKSSANDYDTAWSSQATAFKNLVINGDMQVAQRSSSVAGVTATGYYTADRWEFANISCGTHTMSVENDAPTGSGFRKSLKILCTTADASPAAGDALILSQKLEGQNLQQIAKGTSSAKELTVSFWVKSNVTGTYVLGFLDLDNTRNVGATYTVNASATWEKKTIVFPADTTGALDNDNANSLTISFWLDSGTNFDSGTLNTTWASTVNANRNAGGASLAASTNNYWQITGVQLEVGSTATEFEFLPAQTELALCQRYFEKSYFLTTNPGTNTANGMYWQGGTSFSDLNYGMNIGFRVTKRTSSGTVKTYTQAGVADKWTYYRNGATAEATTTITHQSDGNVLIYVNTGAAWTAVTIAGHWTCSDEL
jgi:hypothetical protein